MRLLLNKHFILLLSIIAAVCFVVAWFVASSSIHCYQTSASGSGQLGCGAGSGASNVGAFVASALGFIGFITALISWLSALVKTARIQAWVWFVVVFVVPVIGSGFYGLFGPELPRSGRLTYIEGTPRHPVTT